MPHSAAADKLLRWYDQNARALPWRGPRITPYETWLSEIMLQQTTVATAIPYFQKFRQRWPNVKALAQAEEADVLREWAGLGYYARARNLLRCARVVAAQYKGRFPRSAAELEKLPGIGPYTAAAIAAIAFGERALALDTNVRRVLQRRLGNPKCRDSGLHAHGLRLIHPQRAGDSVQALMELGARVCLPRMPDCAHCPLARGCKSRAQDWTGQPQTSRPAKPMRAVQALILRHKDGRWLFVRRPSQGLLGGLISLPMIGLDHAATPQPLAAFQHSRARPERLRHVFSHFVADISLMELPTRKNGSFQIGEEEQIWLTPAEALEQGVSSLIRKILLAVQITDEKIK